LASHAGVRHEDGRGAIHEMARQTPLIRVTPAAAIVSIERPVMGKTTKTPRGSARPLNPLWTFHQQRGAPRIDVRKLRHGFLLADLMSFLTTCSLSISKRQP
jgi:hypothetical protein